MKTFNINLGKSLARDEAQWLFNHWQDEPNFTPTVWNMETIVELLDICKNCGVNMVVTRTVQSQETQFNMKELDIAIEHNIEIRPII